MRTLILIYHGTSDGGGGHENLHGLPKRNLRDQMDHLARTNRRVLSWRELASGPGIGDRPGLTIALTFDDGCQSDLENARLLKARGFDALFFIATEYIGQRGYLSVGEILELHTLGMGIGSHSHRHALLTPMSDAQIEQNLSRSKRILEDIVQTPIRHLSFPGGGYSSRVLRVGRSVGYQDFFSSDWGVNMQSQFAKGVFRRTSVLNSLDVAQFEALLSLRNYRARQTLFQVKELTKRALGEDRYWRLRQALVDFVR
jgi:peptidoglycan/xylan/chitin deacetylase (PgdA/CDA1 family)